MSWTRLDIPCPPAFAELVAALVFVETGRGASLCEGVSETIVQAWTPTYRAAETQVRLTKRLSDINVALAEAAHSMTKVEIRDEDWSLGWRRHFKPLRVGKRLVVKPLWESWPSADAPDAARPDDLLIEIDPGGAFGTGTHASTRLALMALERTVTAGDTVIDVGCGSGILSLAALILGAEQVIAVDFDPAAVECTIRNLRNHPVKNRTLVLLADGLSALRARANVIVANLTADAVIRVGERVPTCLEQGGRYIVAGLLEDEVSRVCTGLEDLGLVPQTVDILEGWAAVTLVRRGNSSCVECSSQKKLSKPTESH